MHQTINTTEPMSSEDMKRTAPFARPVSKARLAAINSGNPKLGAKIGYSAALKTYFKEACELRLSSP